MRGDFSRWTHDPRKRYTAVLKQQGRVDTEADWNEQQAITAYGAETRMQDLVGPCGAPEHDAGFEITSTDGDLHIGPGRYYVDGILCENEPVAGADVLYSGQPDLVNPPAIPMGLGVVYLDVWQYHVIAIDDAEIREPALGGPDTATRLRTVWQVRVLPLDEGLPLSPQDLADLRRPGAIEERAEWSGLVTRSPGRLAARTEIPPSSTDPCVIPATAGYRGLENQLYRVEIHQFEGGSKRFKWSRDNGSVVADWIGQSGNELQVATAGRDRVLGFAIGNWVELTDELRELAGQPGIFVPLLRVDGDRLTIDPAQAIPAGAIDWATFHRHPKVRRWDSAGPLSIPAVSSNQWIPLEDGIEVRFRDGAAGSYRTGDYWFIPARTAIGRDGTGDIEWPRAGDPPVFEDQRPQGIVHHYACLALIQKMDAETVEVLDDCRELFPPLTDLEDLDYVGGDAQEGPAGEELPKPLEVGVSNGSLPVEGAFVRFRVVPATAGGSLRNGPPVPGPGAVLAVPTDANGIARCSWRLAEVQGIQSVEAVLLDAGDNDVGIPIRFEAHSLASLFYRGGDGQDGLPGQILPHPLEVGAAIRDRPCAGVTVRFAVEPPVADVGLSPTGAEPPAPTLDVTTDANGVARCYWHLGSDLAPPVVVARLLGSDGTPVHVPIRFGANLRTARNIAYDPHACPTLQAQEVNNVQDAIDVLCQGTEAPGFVVTHVGLGGVEVHNDMQYPIQLLSKGLQVICDAPVDPASILDKPVCVVALDLPYTTTVGMIGFQSVALDGALGVGGEQIQWIPSEVVQKWLTGNPFEGFHVPRILARLALKGNFIWKEDDPDIYLDGEVYGMRGEAFRGGVVSTDLRPDRGDGRRGGDLEMWFWLIRPQPTFVLPKVMNFGTVPILRVTEAVVPIRNTGTGPLVVNALKVTNIKFNGTTVDLPTPPVQIRTVLPVEVPPDGRVDITIGFILPEAGDYSANLRIATNDPERPTSVVALNASGR